MDEALSARIEERLLAKPFQVKTTDDAGSFEGHGAVFEELHPTSSWALSAEWKDRILPGAFKRTLAEHKKAGTTPVMLYMHERGNVVGAWRELEEAKDGLFGRGQVAQSARTWGGTEIRELMKMGALNGLSIGFRVRKQTLDQEKKVRDIHDVELAEISIVDIPGIHRARVTDVKRDGMERLAKPAFSKGDKVKSLVGHMPGMKGMTGTVSIVRTSPAYYGVTMDGEKTVHKWLAEDELEAADDGAGMPDMKSDGGADIEVLERVLRDAGLSRKEAKAVLAKGFSALRDVAAHDGSTSELLASVRALTQAFHP